MEKSSGTISTTTSLDDGTRAILSRGYSKGPRGQAHDAWPRSLIGMRLHEAPEGKVHSPGCA